MGMAETPVDDETATAVTIGRGEKPAHDFCLIMTSFTSCRNLRKQQRNLSLFVFCGDINIKISLVPTKISLIEVGGGSLLAPCRND